MTGQPLWKYLENGGAEAWVEYGKYEPISRHANCTSHAVGDSLYTAFLSISSLPGRFNYEFFRRFSNADIQNNAFLQIIVSGGAKYIGNADSIPVAGNDHYICACFASFATTFDQEPDYHFMRQHADQQWTERANINNPIKIISKDPKNVFDLADTLEDDKKDFKYFIGWFAIPNYGLRTGLDSLVYRISEANSNFSNSMTSELKAIKNLCINKRTILSNVQNLDQFYTAYSEIIGEFESIIRPSEIKRIPDFGTICRVMGNNPNMISSKSFDEAKRIYPSIRDLNQNIRKN